MNNSSNHIPEAGFETLIEENNVGIYEIKGEEFSYVNQRFADVFGYTQAELIGMSPFSLIVEEEHQNLRENMAALASGEAETVVTEHSGVQKDGDEVVIRAHGSVVTTEPEPVYLGFVEDITEYKQRERRFEAIFNNTFQFTGLLKPDGTLLEANETALYFGGLDREDVLGKRLWETYWLRSSEDARQTVRAAVSQASDGNLFRDEIRVQGDDEELVIDFSMRPVTDETGTVTRLITEGRNITERKEREEERQTIIDRVTDAVVEVDKDWRFTLVDERAEEIYEMSEEELRGEYFWDVFTGARGTRFEDVYRDVMETREPATLEKYNSDLDGWFHIEVYPQPDGGLAFYFQDISERKRQEARTAGWNDILSECLKLESKQQVCETISENAEEKLHLPIIAIGLLNDNGSLEPVAQSPLARSQLDETELFDDEDGAAWTAFTTGGTIQIDDPSIELMNVPSVDKLVIHPLGQNGVLVTGLSPQNNEFTRSVAEDVRMIFDRIDREKRLRNRDELLEEQNESLNRLNRINTVIRSIDQGLVHASTRQEIEQIVCEKLTESDTYTFAWIGEYEPTTDQVSPKEWAGHHQGYLDAVSFSVNSGQSSREPTGATVRDREPVVINEVLGDPPHEEWQEAALKRGYRSAIAVPLLYHDSLYGTLTVYSDQSEHIDEMETRVLTELGETVAHAINAIESKQALVSDTVVELELAFTCPDHSLVEFVGQDGERKFEFESIVPSDDGSYRSFYFIHGSSPEEYLDFVDQALVVQDSQLVTEHEEKALFESTLTKESVLFWLIDRGAVPLSFDITQKEGRIRVVLSGDVDVREFINLFKAEYPDSELLASRERQRNVRTPQEFESKVEEKLTDRQREVLQMAYFSGYFETPRNRTGKDLAESLGVSAPTVSDHIRAGLRNLFELLYEDEGEDERGI